VQLYLKLGLAFTEMHTELAYSSALNCMRPDSCGIAIWFAFFVRDLLCHYSLSEILFFFSRRDIEACLKEWQTMSASHPDRPPIRIYIAFQFPATCAYARSLSSGAGHAVLTFGPFVCQIAWNRGVCLDAVRACLDLFSNVKSLGENGGHSTRMVLPVLRLQALTNLPFGLESELLALVREAEIAKQTGSLIQLMDHVDCRLKTVYCDSCGVMLDLVAFGQKCFACYQNSFD